MLQKFEKMISEMHKSFLPSFFNGGKRKIRLFYISYYVLLVACFTTIFGQIPFFASKNLTQLFQIGWIFVAIPIFMLDYKRFLNSMLIVLALLIPFLTYCVISLFLKIPSLSYSGTKLILLSAYMFVIGNTFGKYKTKANVRFILYSYLFGAFIYAGIVFFTKLLGYDLSNQIYAFESKNSAGPIFMCAAIFAFCIFSKKNPLNIFLRLICIIFFIAIIALSKNRAVLIFLPVILIPMLVIDIKNKYVSFGIICAFFIIIILLFSVPFFYQSIIVNILFNGKNTVDEIFSGRLTQIVVNMQNIRPVLGSGNCYFDCMPLSLLCTYGTIGFILLIPFLILPFLIIFRKKTRLFDKRLSQSLIIMAILFLASSLLEGFGYVGPGAKSFILWFMAGLFVIEVEQENSGLSFLVSRSSIITDRISKHATLIVIQGLFIIIPTIIISITSSTISIGNIIADKLPSSNILANYIEVKDIQIDSPIESMCVGQKITFNVKAEPLDAMDKTVYWSSGWISDPPISVDDYTGEVTANKSGEALLSINRFRVGPDGVYIRFQVKEYNNYNFDKLYISSKPYKKSFEHSKDETINLPIGCTSNVFYDNFYLPVKDNFSFISSDESIATVDKETGIIRAIKSGSCDIIGVINNDFKNKSLNKITINVTNDTFVPCTSLDISNDPNCYQFVPYSFNALFNKDASDKKVNITIDGFNTNEYSLCNTQIIFNKPGDAHISVSSQNNPMLKKEFDIHVLENSPSHFICNTTRMKIGEIRNAEQLGLFLAFSNGYKKIVDENDLLFNPRDFTNRAWTNQNGLIKNRTTVMAVEKGTIKIQVTSKINNNVSANFTIISSAYSEIEYCNLCSNIGLTLMGLVNLLCILFTLFLKLKKTVSAIILIIPPALFVLLVGINYSFNTLTILLSALMFLFSLLIYLIRIKKQKYIPLIFLEDPILYVPNENNESNGYIEINV